MLNGSMFARAPQIVPTKVVTAAASRIQSVDAVRGLIIMIMALDHTRDFFHSAAMVFPPEDMTRTWTALFLTRWITHFCAPGFALLAGVSAWLWKERSGRSTSELSRFLLIRGLWLVFLEIIVMRFAMFFGLFSGPLILLVLWSLGCSMIVLAALVYLPVRLLAVVSVIVIATHDLFDRVQANSLGAAAWIWNILHQPGAFMVPGGIVVVVAYPLVPWFAVMACGYCMGRLFDRRFSGRARWLACTGTAFTLAFVALRALNVYGDPRPWSAALHPV